MSQKKLHVYAIYNSDYDHELYNLHEEKKIGKFYLKKKIIPKGQRERFFKDGKVVTSEHFDDYPIIQLKESRGKDSQFDDVWMTDTPYEIETNRKAIEEARGDVLDCGLGIGYFAYHAMSKKEVKSIDIVEKFQEVIDLVYPAIKKTDERKCTRIIHEDAEKYLRTTKRKYDFVHLDFKGGMLPFDDFNKLKKLGNSVLKPNGILVMWQEEVYNQVKERLRKGSMKNPSFSFHDPCLTCGKTLRYDYGGLCMDCADELGVSELGFKI